MSIAIIPYKDWTELSDEQAKAHPLFGTATGWSLVLFLVLLLVPFRNIDLIGQAIRAGADFTSDQLVLSYPFWIWAWVNAALLLKKSKKFPPSYCLYFLLSTYISWSVSNLNFEGDLAAEGIAAIAYQLASTALFFYIPISKRINLNIYRRVKADDPWLAKLNAQLSEQASETSIPKAVEATNPRAQKQYLSAIQERNAAFREGEGVPNPSNTTDQRFEKIKELQERGLISDEEAAQKRKELLDEL